MGCQQGESTANKLWMTSKGDRARKKEYLPSESQKSRVTLYRRWNKKIKAY